MPLSFESIHVMSIELVVEETLVGAPGAEGTAAATISNTGEKSLNPTAFCAWILNL